MFQQIAALLAGNTQLNLMISGLPEKMTVIVMPKSKSADSALNTPLQLVGTAAELDEKFPELIAQYGKSLKGLEEQLADTQAVIEAAKKASSKKAVKALTGASDPKPNGQGSEEDDVDDEDVGDGGAGQPSASPEPAKGNLTASNLFAGL